jgi:type IV pilus assembly protein PilX
MKPLYSRLQQQRTTGVRKSRGIALVFVLIMLTIATSIALISARITLSDGHTARNDRDRQIAFQSAEMALNDAELDIMDPLTERGCKFGTFQLIAGEGCSANADARGLCGPKPSLGNKPIYKDINWDDTTATRAYINYGEFTNRDGALQVGSVGAPSKAPKYILLQTTVPTVVPFKNDAGQQMQYETTSAWRVYALGYGALESTQVLLESVMAKPMLSNKCVLGGGL